MNDFFYICIGMTLGIIALPTFLDVLLAYYERRLRQEERRNQILKERLRITDKLIRKIEEVAK